MRFAFYMNIVSPHQLPLAHEIVRRVGKSNFRYVYLRRMDATRTEMGWSSEMQEWCVPFDSPEAVEWLNKADVLVSGLRELDLFERRCAKGLKTFYTSERWFKPPFGRLRLLSLRYLKLVRRFVRLATQESSFVILPIGVHAQRDFLGMGVPESKMALWGYFVAPSSFHGDVRSTEGEGLKVLWVGRMLKLKNVEILIRAVRHVKERGGGLSLTLVGDGPERARLVQLAEGDKSIQFLPSTGMGQIRRMMREHDVYVFPSNGYDGWGAVVSEALEEGMHVLGSFEAGATATMLPKTQLFHARDWRELARMLQDAVQKFSTPHSRVPLIGNWSAAVAAKRLLALSLY